MKKILNSLVALVLVSACSSDDNTPAPNPLYGETLTEWANFYHNPQSNGQYEKINGHRYLFKFNTNGTVRTIETDKADVTQDRYTMEYTEGKFSGITHRFLRYDLKFQEGRLHEMLFVLPEKTEQLTSIYYQTDKRIDSIVMVVKTPYSAHLSKYKTDYIWKADDLYQVVLYHYDNNFQSKEYLTDTYQYEDKLMPLSFSRLPEGMEFFILKDVFRDNLHLLSKHLISSVIRTYPGSAAKEVTEWEHKMDGRGRLVESFYMTRNFDKNNVQTGENLNSQTYKYYQP